jgi:CRP-like cAMP-binding protein
MVNECRYDRILQAPEGAELLSLREARGGKKHVGVGGPAHTARRIDFLNEGLYQSYLRDPAIFANELKTLPRGATVVVDEIHRLPALPNELYRFIEDHGLRFVLLESIARKLKQAGTNLLAGRGGFCGRGGQGKDRTREQGLRGTAGRARFGRSPAAAGHLSR